MLSWRLAGTDFNNILVVRSMMIPEVFTLNVDSFKTFRLVLTSLLLQRMSDTLLVQQYAIPRPIPEVKDNHQSISVSLLLISETSLDTQIAIVWKGYITEENVKVGWLELQLTKQEGSDEIEFDPIRMCTILSVVDMSVSETFNSFRIRGLLKASREDLVAQLYKPSRVGVDEATFNRYFPEEGDEMYGTFKFKGGKPKKRSKKRSKSRS
jgi:hypothetical protein